MHVRAYSSDVGIVEACLAVLENRCVMPERLQSYLASLSFMVLTKPLVLILKTNSDCDVQQDQKLPF